ncbi:hypothetical protein GDO86_004650 [Hymenochirus boettgeri]|uniref:Rho-GAP domain-containing protein n=1 Tax=Hymenochirus boettgeri TaxID=247094 RepID=A0A8T2K8K7_9PIPI|nr:hypothetical protein GDO86_004650 [Hymenochirus boettgeri]
MSHVRDALPQIEGLKDTDCPLDLHGPFLMEHLPHEMQCQFILKPSRLPPCHQLADSVQKPFKRKRSIINWTFWRSSSQLDNLPSSPTSSTPGMLFGLSLSAIAENGNLPKPVMDMLSVLCREGPFTRGIFRRSANAKSCKEMKEKLNSGYEVNYELESVFVIASVFKDFLRNVPGSVFSSKLYDKWISILGQGSEGEKIQGIKKLIETLPQINIILLRYLFGVLHCIEQRSDTNQMSAFNLAVCIAPSLLWPLNPSGPAVEGELTRKVSDFVQFLIENCCVVFDEDISLLYAKHDPRENSGTNTYDICLFKHNDSSYDSLENELNDEADSPFSDFPKKHSPDNRSRDSVLTLSDCDLDHPDGEDAQNENPLESQSLRMATILQHSSFIHKQSKKESLSSNTSGYPSATFSKALKYARRPRRSSEPAIAILVSRFSKLNECPCENAVLNTSCDELNHTADNYLKQHRDLQVEGQKLINRSLTLGIGVSKGINKKTAEKRSTPKRLLVPPALTLGPQTCSSSLSSPGTSPSGSSLSSLDSAFSQFSDYSVLTSTNELPSPLESNFRSHKKPLELTPDNVSSSFFSGVIVDEDPKQPFGDRSSENDIKGTCHKIPPRIHPNAWLKCGNSAIKNWSLRKKQKLKSLEEKNKNCRNLNPEEPQSESCNISECSVLGEQTTVPKAENLHLPTLQKNENVADSKPSSSSLYEVSCEGKNTSRHLLRDKVMIDNNDTGDYEKEHSSFHSPSALPAYSKEKTIIPHTLFFGQECALYSQTNKRKMNNSLSVEQSVVLDTNVKGSGDSETRRLADEDTSACKTLTANFRVASLKRNKVLPSNIDTGFKMANCDLEKNFCVSPKPVTTTESFFFQPDSEKHIKNCHNINFTTSQNNSEWQNKFEDIDQRFHPEESYV